MGTPYNGQVLKEPPTQRKPYTGQVLASAPRRPGYLPAGSRDDSEVVVNPPSLPESVLGLMKGLASIPERAFKGEMGNGKPVMLPLKAGPDGLGFGPSEATDALARGITAPRRAATGQMTFEQMKREAPETAAVAITGGLSTPRILIPAGAKTMNAVGPPLRATANAVSSAAKIVAEPLMNKFGDMNTGIGRSLLRRAMQDNPGLSPEDAIAQVEAQLQRLGAPSVLADTGKSAQKLARNLAQGPGETGNLAEKTLGGRQASEKTRMIDSFNTNISNKKFYDVDAEAEDAMTKASPHFKAAFKANPSVVDPVLDKLLLTPVGREALAFARQRIENRMAKMAIPDKELTEQLNDLVLRGEATASPGGVAAGLKLETHDLIRQNLYDQMQLMKKKLAKGDVRKGEYNEVRDIYNEYRQRLVDADATGISGPNSRRAGGGEYERGLNRYKDAAKLQEALEAGRAFVRGDPEILEEGFGKLSTREKDGYRAGVVKELVEKIGRDSSDLTPADIMATLKAESTFRKKFTTIAPTQSQFDNMMGDIERELTFRATNRGTRNVSQTGSILMEEGQVAQDALRNAKEGGGILMDAGQGRLASAGIRALDFAVTQLSRMRMPEEMRNRIGRLLVSPDPADKEQALRLMRAVAPQSMPKPPPGIGRGAP